jgi:hypothetical protein
MSHRTASAAIATVMAGLSVVLWNAGTTSLAAAFGPPQVAVERAGHEASSTTHLEDDEFGTLRVHVQLPSSVPAGSSRQLRVQVSDADGSLAGEQAVRLSVDLDHVPAEGSSARVQVRPSRLLVGSDRLHGTAIHVGAVPGTACDADLGELRVEIRELHENGRSAEVVVPLPVVDCRALPPPAPEAVHSTDPVCTDGGVVDTAAIARQNPPSTWCRSEEEIRAAERRAERAARERERRRQEDRRREQERAEAEAEAEREAEEEAERERQAQEEAERERQAEEEAEHERQAQDEAEREADADGDTGGGDDGE